MTTSKCDEDESTEVRFVVKIIKKVATKGNLADNGDQGIKKRCNSEPIIKFIIRIFQSEWNIPNEFKHQDTNEMAPK